MRVEYCVMFKRKNKWTFLDGKTFGDIGLAKGEIKRLRLTYNEMKFRLACREVGDWCECKEGKRA